MVTQKRGIRYSPFFIVVYLSSKDKKMAKVKASGGNSIKVSFGKRKSGKAAKSHNKHDRGEKNYRGQGR